MRIVQVIPDFDLGGVQKAGQVLANAMSALGHDTWLLGQREGDRSDPDSGARFDPDSTNPQYVNLDGNEEITRFCREIDADVVHHHTHEYERDLIERLNDAVPNAVVVTTPVFGRPPEDRRLLRSTKTCCVGLYCFYRLLKWLGQGDPRKAVESGIAAAPLTSFEPPQAEFYATDAPDRIAERRQSLNVDPASFVVGRIGRDSPHKWHVRTSWLIDQLLSSDDNISWLSIGLPAERGRDELRRRWGDRFVNLEQTTDYELICKLLSCLDIQVFSSTSGECFASSICEPAGLGVPTVAVSSPLHDNGQAEQVVDGTTGYLVGDLDQLVEHIIDLARAQEVLPQLKSRTRQYVDSRWHCDVVAKNVVDVYEYWRTPDASLPPYLVQLIRDHEQFAGHYHDRMRTIHCDSAFSRIRLSASLHAAESWPVHRLAAWMKNRTRR